MSSAASAANAIVETVRNVAAPTGQIFSTAVPSPGPEGGYGVPEGIVFGYPMRGGAPGEVEIVQGIAHDDWAQQRIAATLAELVEERDAVTPLRPRRRQAQHDRRHERERHDRYHRPPDAVTVKAGRGSRTARRPRP